MIFEYIQSLLLIIAAVMIIIAAVGLVSLKNDMKNVIYARILIVGLFDIAIVIGFIALTNYLLAGIYLILAPFTAHAIAKSNFINNDDFNNPKEEIEGDVCNNPFIHPIKELKKDKNIVNDDQSTFSISKIEINEAE